MTYFFGIISTCLAHFFALPASWPIKRALAWHRSKPLTAAAVSEAEHSALLGRISRRRSTHDLFAHLSAANKLLSDGASLKYQTQSRRERIDVLGDKWHRENLRDEA